MDGLCSRFGVFRGLEQEIEEEEMSNRVFLPGDRNVFIRASTDSAWLNTPYTPARTAGKPPETTNPIISEACPYTETSKDTIIWTSLATDTSAPTLSLKRAMGEAIAQERRSPNARVMNSLPPMAKTTGQRWTKSNQDGVGE